MATYELQLRREIRRHIEATSSKMGISLAQNIIENLVTQRVTEIANRDARGPEIMVIWDDIVKKAVATDVEALQQLVELGRKLPTSWRDDEQK